MCVLKSFRSQMSFQTLFNKGFVTSRADRDSVRGLVTAVKIEERVESLLEVVQEGVEVSASQDVIEGDLPLLVVYIHPNTLELVGEREQQWRAG